MRQADTVLDTGAGITNLASYFRPSGSLLPLPWKLRSRLVGNTLDFVVAQGTDPLPPWGTSGQSGSYTIPVGIADAPGMSGLYMAHLNPGETVDIDNVSVIANTTA